MRFRFAALFLLAAACSSEDGTGTERQGQGALDPSPRDVAAVEDGILTPANLPADVCDAPGTTDRVVPSGTSTALDPNACDAVLSQGPALPSICLRKFANVTVAGELTVNTNASTNAAIAIVATGAFDVIGSIVANGALQLVACGDLNVPGRVVTQAGGGGGTGGTLLIEAKRVLTASSTILSAVGGAGSVGRIRINVPEGSVLPHEIADPPATIGAIGTH